MDELDALVVRTEAEAAAVEAQVEDRRQALLAEQRSRVRELAKRMGALESGIDSAAGEATALVRRVNQEEARHELELASTEAPRSPFPRLHWLPGRAVAVALFAAGFAMSLPYCWVTAPGLLGAWLVGRSRRDVR